MAADSAEHMCGGLLTSLGRFCFFSLGNLFGTSFPFPFPFPFPFGAVCIIPALLPLGIPRHPESPDAEAEAPGCPPPGVVLLLQSMC